MKTRLILAVLVFGVTACGRPASPTPQPDAATAATFPTLTLQAPTLTPPATSTDAPVATAPAVATSRGPDLEATDPSTVVLASGGLHFVEFFRFT
jgi:hypothetical protein